MGNIAIYHPGTDATVAVPEESVAIYRQAGWLTRTEWDEHQALNAARAAEVSAAEAEAAKAARSTATGRPAGGEAKKE
jgi:hypothetical protein